MGIFLLNNQNGQDMKNGAVWDIQYVDGYGFTLKNIGTGKYLHDAAPAKYDTPTYFTFCTIGGTSGVKTINSDNHDELTGYKNRNKKRHQPTATRNLPHEWQEVYCQIIINYNQ